jgi:hypothetical protein
MKNAIEIFQYKTNLQYFTFSFQKNHSRRRLQNEKEENFPLYNAYN